MKIILKTLYIVVALFLMLFLESIFVHLFAFKLIFLVFLFVYRKVDWKKHLAVTVVMALAMDVVMHYKLGTNLLMFMIPLGLFSLFSLFSSVEDGIGSYIVQFFSIFVYYILSSILPTLLLSGTLGTINGKTLLHTLLCSVLSIILLFLINNIMGGIRRRGNTSQIRLK